MPKTCVVKNCKSVGAKDSRIRGLTFHRLPAEPVIRQKWLDNIRRVNKDGTPWVPYKSATVCSKHFKKSCFHGQIVGVDDAPALATAESSTTSVGRISRHGKKTKFFRDEDPLTNVDEEEEKVNVAKNEEEEFVVLPEKRRGKPPKLRRVLFPHAIPTEDMGIPTPRLSHCAALPFPKKYKPSKERSGCKKESGGSGGGGSGGGGSKGLSLGDANIIEALGCSKKVWSKLTEGEREEQRRDYACLTQMMVDHSYSSSVLQGPEKLADDNKKLRLLVEKLVHKCEAERTKFIRVQNSLARACSMLEQCSEYDFFDTDGCKVARPRDVRKKGQKAKPVFTARHKGESAAAATTAAAAGSGGSTKTNAKSKAVSKASRVLPPPAAVESVVTEEVEMMEEEPQGDLVHYEHHQMEEQDLHEQHLQEQRLHEQYLQQQHIQVQQLQEQQLQEQQLQEQQLQEQQLQEQQLQEQQLQEQQLQEQQQPQFMELAVTNAPESAYYTDVYTPEALQHDQSQKEVVEEEFVKVEVVGGQEVVGGGGEALIDPQQHAAVQVQQLLQQHHEEQQQHQLVAIPDSASAQPQATTMIFAYSEDQLQALQTQLQIEGGGAGGGGGETFLQFDPSSSGSGGGALALNPEGQVVSCEFVNIYPNTSSQIESVENP